MAAQPSWTLVIWVKAFTGLGGPAVIPGFSSEKACEEAVDRLRAFRNISVPPDSWFCVEVK